VTASDDKIETPRLKPKPRGPVVFSCPFLQIRQDAVTGAGYATGSYYVLERPDSVSVVPVSPSGRTVLLRQERHPVDESTWEFPGGHIDPGETPEEAARREIREEAGLVGGTLEKLSWHFPIAGLSATRTTVFALRLDEAGLDAARVEPGMDEIAELRIVRMAEVGEMIRTGRIRDAFTIAAYAFYVACGERQSSEEAS
jgi:8-oxo-dGTP pyrophosphatase MutT (NUDIX family)